jgi:hypothetical protein
MSRLSKIPLWVPVLAALAGGAYALVHALTSWSWTFATIAIAAGVLFLIAVLIWPRRWGKANVCVLHVVGAALVAFLALAGVNVLTNKLMEALELGSLPIWFGLILAVEVFGLVAFWYLMGRGWKLRPAKWTSAVLAAVVILVVPVLVGILNDDQSSVPSLDPTYSELDVLIVSDGSRHEPPPPLSENPALEEFDVRYSVGYAVGEEVRWTLLNAASETKALHTVARGDEAPVRAAPPIPRDEADTVLLLLVDGTAPFTEDPRGLPEKQAQGDEVSRWKRVAKNAAPEETPAYALLQSREEPPSCPTTGPECNRFKAWESFGSPGRAVSAQGYGSQTVTDAAVHLAVAAPTAQADLALAMEHRPILLFDDEESVPWPISVDALFKKGALTLCSNESIIRTDCGDELRHPIELKNGDNHLQLDLDEFGNLDDRARAALKVQREEAASLVPGSKPPGAGSAIYVHPHSTTRDGQELLYLDYWWYLPENPVGVGGGALCGAGFVIPGVTCLNHQSDWEGITVVVDRTGDKPKVKAVHYAQHDHVVRYGWGELRARWDKLGNAKVKALLDEIPDASRRPIAFVANGTHATYPIPCGACGQGSKTLGEGQRRGDLGWVGNNTDACGRSSCLQMLPTTEEGEEPALWNAYDGLWGERNCYLTYYCDSASPPSAPGKQGRYEDPTDYDHPGNL